MKIILNLLTLLWFILSSQTVLGGEVLVAVAANFAAPAQKISILFEQETGHKITLSIGSTGKFYTQIKNGSPYDILLAADDETPARLENEGMAQTNTRFTYATGKLVLWSKEPSLIDDKGAILKSSGFNHIAIADPKLAPYGRATMETLIKLGLDKQIPQKAVWGESIGQAYLFVQSQAAELGFVALSQIFSQGRITEGSAWIVPEEFHFPIKQDALLLRAGKDNSAAKEFLTFLKSSKAKELIRSFGYAV
jgi:molybdate transport system substrate-binding protein